MRAYGRNRSLLESWLELRTTPLFQLHRFSDPLLEILANAPYGLMTTSVKAVLVSAGTPRACLSMKVPSTPEIRSAAGLLIQAHGDQPAPELPPPAVQPDLLDPHLAVPMGQPPARVAGLYMTQRRRVLSITAYRVRLVATGDIASTYGFGIADHRNPGAGQELPADDLDALDDLLP